MARARQPSLRSASAALVVLLLTACGGNEEAAVRSEALRSPLTTASVTEPTQGADAPPGSADHPNVFVNVTNQSFDDPDVHITVSVAGQPFVDQNFPVMGQHHVVGFELSLAPGEHRLEVTSDTGVTRRVPVTVSAQQPVYVHLAYWDYEDEVPHFDALVRDEPFGYG